MPAYIRLDLFPATVTRGDGTQFNPCRAVVTDDEVYVFVDASPRPTLAFSAKLDDFTSISRTHWRVMTDGDLEQIEINKRAGCGCGNKLKGFNAFPGVPIVRNK
jgi:hypothetical protein